jgi:hypothetical protein
MEEPAGHKWGEDTCDVVEANNVSGIKCLHHKLILKIIFIENNKRIE